MVTCCQIVLMTLFFLLPFSRASIAVNCLDRLHQTKKRGLVPCSLYLTLITSKVMFRICPAFKSSRLKTIGNCQLFVVQLSADCSPTK